jgi:hypothetical protein
MFSTVWLQSNINITNWLVDSWAMRLAKART